MGKVKIPLMPLFFAYMTEKIMLFFNTFCFIILILTMILIISLHQTQQHDNLLMERGRVEERGLSEEDTIGAILSYKNNWNSIL